uniref:Cadherin domain-containing protein n=1 Tax=Romanomermis culicivorax TaxID=13658 RepID=A0A915HM40_ROMCU
MAWTDALTVVDRIQKKEKHKNRMIEYYSLTQANKSERMESKQIFDFYYEPEGAELLMDSFRSKLADYYQSKPNYPSKFTLAYLTLHILCNNNTYPISILKIKSINRFAPIFYHTPYVMKIPESGNIDDTFSIERIQNIVHAVQNISYFSHGQEKYSIWSPNQLPHDKPTDVNLKPRKKFTILKINIQDVDDLPPLFEQKEYFGQLNGNDFGRTIVTVKAFDGDKTLNATIRYKVFTESLPFEVDSITGEAEQLKDPTKFSVVLVKIKDVDFPSRKNKLCLRSRWGISHDSLINENDLKFKADNVLNEQTTYREMDQAKRVLNDLLPLINTTSKIFEFERFVYEVSIHENTPIGSDVVKVRAKVKDDIYNGSPSSADFVIDEDSGMIKLASNLNMKELPSYVLVVRATEHSTGLTCFTVLWINVLDHAEPRLIFDPIPDRIYISQSKPVNTTIFTLKAYKIGQENDSNTRKFAYSVNDANHFFAIGDQSGKIIVGTALLAGEYKITVTAVDEATLLSLSHDMIISVLNDSSLYPVFDQLTYELDLYENDTQTKILNFGNPRVKNGNVVYEMMPSIVPGITIDREKVILNDKEEITKFAFNLSFISPLFRATLPENSPVGTVLNLTLSISGTKEEYKNITYSLDENPFFSIEQSGALYLINSIDLETLEPSLNGVISLTAHVKSAQSGDSAIVQVKILDEDEYSPSFPQETYEFTVDKNAAPSSNLFTVAASDADFNDHSLHYEIDPQIPYFSVNAQGVFMRTNLSLPQAAANTFNFKLIARDQGNKTASTSVVVKFSKSAAPFRSSPYVWSITSDQENPTFDMKIPKDGKPLVSIIHGNEDNHFVIDQLVQEDDIKLEVDIKPEDISPLIRVPETFI